MKTLSSLRESVLRENLSKNPGNGIGLSNRYTPINNIVVDLKNYFGTAFGIVVTQGQGTAIELRCSRWISKKEVENDLYNSIVAGSNIYQYTYSKGLQDMAIIQEYDRYMVVFYSKEVADGNADLIELAKSEQDIPTSKATYEGFDFEIVKQCKINEEEEEEMEDTTYKKLDEILSMDDRVKAAVKFSDLVSTQMNLPPDYYFKAVKDKEGNESIALRYKTSKRRPFGKKAEVITSIMNIYGYGDEAIWIGGYDDPDSMPDDQKQLLDNLLKFLGAEKTTDVCVYQLKNPDEKDPEDDKNPEDGENDNTENNEDDNK